MPNKPVKRNPKPRRTKLMDPRELILEKAIDIFDGFFNAVLDQFTSSLPRPGQFPQVPGRSQPKNRPQEPSQRPQTRPKQAQLHSYYDELEVSPRASQETITAAFRSLAKRLHPDVTKKKDDQERMRRVNEAYRIIGEPQNRLKYDGFLRMNGVQI